MKILQKASGFMKRNLFKRILVFSILTIGSVSILSGCSEANETAGKEKVDLSKVTIVLGDQAGMTKAKVEASKVLEGTPYKVKWASFQGAAPLFEAVIAGSVDTAPAGDTPVLAAAASDVPIKIIATSVSSPKAVGILVKKNSSIKTIKDLKGKTVVVSSAKGSIAQYLLIEALKEEGLSTKDVNIKFVLPTDAAAAFKAGQLEAWATFDPYLAIAEKNGGRVLRTGEGINTGLGFITASEKALQDPGKKAALQDVIKRISKAWEWENKNKEQYVKLYSDITRLPNDVSKTINGRVNAEVRPVKEKDIHAVQKVADVFKEENVLAKEVDVDKLVDKEIFTAK
ncbi:ABC transporter substrate-binding protein [Priestia megaterium]|uniref:ABC transporter substrate-binding protein n=1 Tax=Priestia megaterium TaxID=1404 RepID=UPI0018A262E2|nr:ABC transporter substrate-binding protein [Priestia megaterium]